MVGLRMQDESVIDFSVTCEISPGQHVRLVSKKAGHWDFTNGVNLKCTEGGGADLSTWSCTLNIPVKDVFEYRYGISDGTSFVNLSPILSLTPKESKIQRNDGNFGVLLDFAFPTEQSWLHSHTQLSFTLDYPDYYTSSPKHPRLGLQLSKKDNTAYTSTTSVWNGMTKLFDNTHDLTSPTSFNITQLSSLTHVQFDLQSSGSPIGKVFVLASQLTGGHGVFTAPILDGSSSIMTGSITFHYSMATPFSHPLLGKTITRKSFPVKPTLVGHRGSGAEGARTQFAGAPRSHIRENTLLSFEKAGASGAHFVEFDVHLTSDAVPVIYHDFMVSHKNISIPIHSLTLEEFKKVGSKVITKTNSSNNLFEKQQTEIPLMPPIPSDPAHPELAQPIFDSFPTLRETLTKVPANIGFNIEVKYPIKDELEKHNIRPVDRNKYIDCILWDVFECAKDREIVFSSFDPDICVILSRKQPRYPVLFLTEMGTRLRSDPRCNSPSASIHFATANQLQGLVCPATFLLNNPDVIAQIKKAGLVVATWGRDNNKTENVDKQLELGVNGIIVDHVAYIAKHWHTKTF